MNTSGHDAVLKGLEYIQLLFQNKQPGKPHHVFCQQNNTVIDLLCIRSLTKKGNNGGVYKHIYADLSCSVIHRQMPTPIDTVSDVFHKWGLGPQAEWDMPQPP